MPTLKRGDLEMAVRNLGFSRRKARQAVQNTFRVMGKWLARDRRMPLELGSGESKEVCGEFKVRPQLHEMRAIYPPGKGNILFKRRWQILWENHQGKEARRAKTSAPPRLEETRRPVPTSPRQMPASFRWLPSSSLRPMLTSALGRRTRF